MQTVLATTPNQENLYTSERTFTAAKYEEAVWDRLLPGEAESYRYHLAFEISKVKGFKTGYAAVRRGGVVVMLAPYFITDCSLEKIGLFPLKSLSQSRKFLGAKMLCVGSPITDSGKLGITRDHHVDAAMISALHEQLEEIAEREGASTIVFRDILRSDAKLLANPLVAAGFEQIAGKSLATLNISFANIEGYLQSLDQATRNKLRQLCATHHDVQIEEYDGMPPDLEAIYELYLNHYEHNSVKFEKLTPEFFESINALMPGHCRYVLYRAEGQLIGFNLLLHRDGVLLDKYMGLNLALSHQYNLHALSWMHNIEMCIRDGLHTYKSQQSADQEKAALGAELQQTYNFLLFRDRYAFARILHLAGDHCTR